MEKEKIILQTTAFVKEKLSGEASGHDWWHVWRVWKTALYMCEKENANTFVVQLAALLHDIADYKFHGGDDSVGPRVARDWLESLAVEEEVIAHVCTIIKDASFKGAHVTSHMSTIEGKIVQDADRLDAIGAIGVARAFAYGGHKGREIYNPDIPPHMHNSFEEYKNNHSPAINHFYEKLLLLKDLMNTETAKRMAQERHAFMERYLEQFYTEWEGKA